MARIPKNSAWGSLQGTLGKEVVFKQYADKVVVSKYPDMSRVQPSERQIAQRKRLQEANQYARSVLRDAALRAELEQGLQPGESVYHKAKRLYLQQLAAGSP